MIPATFCQNLLLMTVSLHALLPARVTMFDIGLAAAACALEAALYLWEKR